MENSIGLEKAIQSVTKAIQGANETVKDFQEYMAKNGVSEAVRWRGDATFRAEAFIQESARLYRYLGKLYNGEIELTETLEKIHQSMDQIVQNLVGYSEFAVGDGPWTGGSSCPYSNLQRIQAANALRDFYALQKRVVSDLKKTDEEFAAEETTRKQRQKHHEESLKAKRFVDMKGRSMKVGATRSIESPALPGEFDSIDVGTYEVVIKRESGYQNFKLSVNIPGNCDIERIS